MSSISTPDTLSVSQAAFYLGITRIGVWFALKKKLLIATKENKRWIILKSDLENYKKNLYKRKIPDGYWDINGIATHLKKPAAHVYYLKNSDKRFPKPIQFPGCKAYKIDEVLKYLEERDEILKSLQEKKKIYENEKKEILNSLQERKKIYLNQKKKF